MPQLGSAVGIYRAEARGAVKIPQCTGQHLLQPNKNYLTQNVKSGMVEKHCGRKERGREYEGNQRLTHSQQKTCTDMNVLILQPVEVTVDIHSLIPCCPVSMLILPGKGAMLSPLILGGVSLPGRV